MMLPLLHHGMLIVRPALLRAGPERDLQRRHPLRRQPSRAPEPAAGHRGGRRLAVALGRRLSVGRAEAAPMTAHAAVAWRQMGRFGGLPAASWLALIALAVLWEWLLAPLRPGGLVAGVERLVNSLACCSLRGRWTARSDVKVMAVGAAAVCCSMWPKAACVRPTRRPPARWRCPDRRSGWSSSPPAIVYLRPFKRRRSARGQASEPAAGTGRRRRRIERLTPATRPRPYLTTGAKRYAGAALADRATGEHRRDGGRSFAPAPARATPMCLTSPVQGKPGLVGATPPDASGRAVVISMQRMRPRPFDRRLPTTTITVEAGCVLATGWSSGERAEQLFTAQPGRPRASATIGRQTWPPMPRRAGAALRQTRAT